MTDALASDLAADAAAATEDDGMQNRKKVTANTLHSSLRDGDLIRKIGSINLFVAICLLLLTGSLAAASVARIDNSYEAYFDPEDPVFTA